MREYYDRRAPEYDRTSWLVSGEDGDEVRALEAALAALPPAPTLDVAIGTGFISRALRGSIVGCDASAAMVRLARARLPGMLAVCGDGLRLPFADASFERVFSAHFYSHLRQDEARRFLAEARRVGRELVLVDTARSPDAPPDGWEARPLEGGSTFEVWKRRFGPGQLLAEAGGGDVLHAGAQFVAVRARLSA